MPTIDSKFMRDARTDFIEKYEPKIKEMGYNLGAGVIHPEGVPTIEALIYLRNEQEKYDERIIIRVESVFREKHTYKRESLPIKTKILGPIKPF